MNGIYRHCFLILTMLLMGMTATAQRRPDSARRDTARPLRDTAGLPRDTAAVRRDSMRARRAREIESLFADTARLTASDYQLLIERNFVVLDQISNSTEDSSVNKSIQDELRDYDSAIALIRDNVVNNSGALNLRNLQVFRILLQNLHT
ncbi:MAG: hypothetical protein EOO11_08235, partial [Chitinophagaceae bacterium]